MKSLKALKEYFTRDRIFTWSILIMAAAFFFRGEFASLILCFVLLEIRDIRELLEDKS